MKKNYSITVIKPADELNEESLSSIYGGKFCIHCDLIVCKPNTESQDPTTPPKPVNPISSDDK